LKNAIIVVLFVSTALVLLGSLNQNSFAGHDTLVFTQNSDPKEIPFRDVSNTNPQSSSSNLDNTSFFPGENVMVTVTEADANVDLDNIDTISVTATTPSGFNKVVMLSETDKNTGVFTGIFNLDNVAPPELLTVTHTPEPNGVGRFLAELSGINDPGIVEVSDFIITNQAHVSCDRTLVTHPVRLEFAGPPPDEISVTLSYANGIDIDMAGGDGNLEMLYAPFVPGEVTFVFTTLTPPLIPGPNFLGGTVDLSGHDRWNNFPAEFGDPTITNILQPPSPEGMYAIGYDDDGCSGGGGGGVARAGFVLVVTAEIVDSRAIGGEIIPIDTASLLLVGFQTNLAWIIPISLSAVGVGIYLTKSRWKK